MKPSVSETFCLILVLGLLLYAMTQSGCYKTQPYQPPSKRSARVCHEVRKLANATFADCRSQHLTCLASCQSRKESETESCATYECLTAAFTCTASAVGFEQRSRICIRPLVASVSAGPSIWNDPPFELAALP